MRYLLMYVAMVSVIVGLRALVVACTTRSLPSLLGGTLCLTLYGTMVVLLTHAR